MFLAPHTSLLGQVYYVVRLNDNDSVCVVPGDQLQPSVGSRLAIGATCEVAREGGGTQQATIIGVGWCSCHVHVL